MYYICLIVIDYINGLHVVYTFVQEGSVYHGNVLSILGCSYQNFICRNYKDKSV